MTDKAMLAADLEALLQGVLTAGALRSKYGSSVPASPLLDSVWGNLQHYLDDAGIRALDRSYRELQEGELRKLIALLRSDAPTAALARVTFLSPT